MAGTSAPKESDPGVAMTAPGPFLRLEGISKSYGGVAALSDVNFTCDLGRIHAVVGENGAGKSSLMKIIAGVVRPDSGKIIVRDKQVSFSSPAESSRHGIACIFQELSLLPDLSVSDNIWITNPPTRFGLIDRAQQSVATKQILHDIGCNDIHPSERVKDLPLSRQQIVEIAKALVRKPRLMIMDEATSALTSRDVEQLYRVIRQLRDKGLAILFISHRMHEITALADVCSVFRNGRHIETFPMFSRSAAQIVPLMIGRDVAQAYPHKPTHNLSQTSPPRLEVKNLQWEQVINDISAAIGPGEILGLGGLDGQGQKELLLALFGVMRAVKGEVRIDGKPRKIGHPRFAKSAKIRMALIPEDRKTEGLLLPMSIRDNLVLAAAPELSNHGMIDAVKERAAVEETVRKLQIKVGRIEAPVRTLSGGNQQKVVVGKWLMEKPRILLLNDPTRGIDVGTKQELYRLIRELATSGISILFYSTDYEELIGMCDRVVVCYEGRLVQELRGKDLTAENLIAASLNLSQAETQSAEAISSIKPIHAGSGTRAVWRRFWRKNAGPCIAFFVAVLMLGLFAEMQPNGLNINVLTSISNKAVVLALVAMGQTLVILTGGFDLSAGMVMTMSSCLASVVITGSAMQVGIGVCLVVLSGALAGIFNALVIVKGRLQPIIATLATGAIYYGIALILRPSPGGDVNEDLSNALTYSVGGLVPTTFVVILGVLILVWWPFRNIVTGRTCFAVGSSENAAYMSGLPIGRARFAAYILAGLLYACGGLFLTLISLSGEASAAQGGVYTLNSIAAVAIGGTSLFGGAGGMLGAIFGAAVLRTISDLLFVFNAPALWQPLFQGFILLGAVCLGSIRALRRKNQMDVFL